MSKRVRFLALLLALLMLCGVLAGAMSMTVRAATLSGGIESIQITGNSDTGLTRLRNGKRYTIKFNYRHDLSSLDLPDDLQEEIKKNGMVLGSPDFSLIANANTGGAFKKSEAVGTATELELEIVDFVNGIATIEGTVRNALCTADNRTNLAIQVNSASILNHREPYTTGDERIIINTASYLENNSSGSINVGGSNSDDDNTDFKSEIVIENIYFTDANGERIDKVDKDTPAFNLVVLFVDYGLREIDDDEFDDKSLEVFLTESAGFLSTSGNRGTLKYLNSSSTEAPRFRASFSGVTFNGDSNAIALRVQYIIDGETYSGTVSATANQARDDDDDDKLSPLTPHIIVNQYSYGNEQINAGSNFTLNMSVMNTSPDIPLENIIMTIQPYIPENNSSSTTGGLTITSSSNTLYIPALGVGESYSHSIDLRAEPSAAVGSHKLEISFSFQYVDEVNKKRESAQDEESIFVPVSQVDRFSVDPLTEYPDIMMVGESDYITLSFVNKGKSITYNISGILTSNMLTTPQNVHFGNLEAGEADTLDFEVSATEVGEMAGEITLQYEDENADLNEIVIPFSIQVEEAFDPWGEDPWGGEEWVEPEPESAPLAAIIWCAIGGLLIAVPIALYLHKRVKAKGIEDLDEDF